MAAAGVVKVIVSKWHEEPVPSSTHRAAVLGSCKYNLLPQKVPADIFFKHMQKKYDRKTNAS